MHHDHHASLEPHRTADADADLDRQLASSAGYWGDGAVGPWLAEAKAGLRQFQFGISGFHVELDHAERDRGWSARHGIHLDGKFGLLVHHRGDHVMTIGLSVASEERLLLQQVQLSKPTGNRWLFKLPPNRLEFVIDRLHEAFPHFDILVADPRDVAAHSVAGYRSAADTRLAHAAELDAEARHARDEEEWTDTRERAGRARDLAARSIAGITRLEADLPRLRRFYSDTGRHALRGSVRVNGIRHHAVERDGREARQAFRSPARGPSQTEEPTASVLVRLVDAAAVGR